MKKLLLIFIVIACFPTLLLAQDVTTNSVKASQQYFSKWEINEVAPGGRIDAIRQLDENVVVCAARGQNRGKLFISYNNGLTWRFLAQPVSSDITCIAETGNKNEFYILTGTAEVWSTQDGGKSWKHLKTLLSKNKNREGYAAAYAIMYTQRGTLLVTDTDSDGGHIYRSVDKGATWQDMGAISQNALYRLERTGNGIVVNGWQGVVYKSEDDGLTWNSMQQLSDAALFATEYMGMSVLLQADQSGTIFRSPNLGYVWDSIMRLPGSADDFVNIGYGAAYYGTYTGKKEIFLTTNYGRTWITLDTVPTIQGDWLDHGIRLETRDSIIVLSGTNKGFVLRTAFQKHNLAIAIDSFNGINTQIKEAKIIPDAAIMASLVDVNALNEPEDIVFSKGFVFIPCRDGNNVAIIDSRNPAKPKLAHSLHNSEILDAFGVAIEKDHLFVLSMTNNMVSVYDIKNPGKPRKVSAIKIGGSGSYLTSYRSNYTRLRKIVVDNGYAYVTHSSESKVYILDIRKPEQPKIVSSFHTGDGAFAVLVQNDVLYLAGYGPGSSLITVDVSNKRMPVITSKIYDSIQMKGTCALAIHNKYLYVTAYNADRVWSFNISNPLSPKVVESLHHVAMRGPGRIAFYGCKAFVLNSINNSVSVIDTRNGSMKMDLFLQHPLLKRVYGIAITNNLLLLAGREAKSFMVVDIPTLLDKNK